MPIEAFEDVLDLHIGLLTAQSPSETSYPFPSLLTGSDSEMRTFRVVILEHEYLRVTIVPGLGGRILSIFDKRTGLETLKRHPTLEPQIGGPRGAVLREGVTFSYSREPRLTEMGNVAYALQPEGEENTICWIAESVSGTGFGFHQAISLVPGQALIQVEFRIQNRTLLPLPYEPTISIYLGDQTNGYAIDWDAGVRLISDLGIFNGSQESEGTVQYSRFGSLGSLGPRQVDTFSFRLAPASGLGGFADGDEQASCFFSSEALRIQTSKPRLHHRLQLLTEAGQTLEAPVNLYPEKIEELSLVGLPSPPKQLVLVDDRGEIVGSYFPSPLESEPVPYAFAPSLNRSLDSVADQNRALIDPIWRPISHLVQGRAAVRRKDGESANLSFEKSLLYNGDDPLTWWEKAMANRLFGEDQEESPELLNAHFLSPLEPALRAEGFLALGSELSREPHALVAPLADHPEDLVEVACLLIEAEQIEEASRWIDEAIRHRDLVMLRYLQAYLLTSRSRMEAEASLHIVQASKIGDEPPFPWREIEKKALKTLVRVFSADEKILRWALRAGVEVSA